MAEIARKDNPAAAKGNGGRPKKTNRGRKIPRTSKPLDDSPITPEMVAEACRTARIATPDQPELRRLAAIFSGYKGIFLAAHRDRELNRLASRAGEAIAILLDVLPRLGDHYAFRARAGDPYAERQARAIRNLVDSAQRNGECAGWKSNAPAVVRDWRWVAGVILPVVAPAFRGIRGTAKGGPITRFLAGILPLITGDAPTAAAIGTTIAALRRTA